VDSVTRPCVARLPPSLLSCPRTTTDQGSNKASVVFFDVGLWVRCIHVAWLGT
jgi:hypothetical protein